MLLDEDAIVADIRAHGYHIAEGAIPDELVRAHPAPPSPHPRASRRGAHRRPLLLLTG